MQLERVDPPSQAKPHAPTLPLPMADTDPDLLATLIVGELVEPAPVPASRRSTHSEHRLDPPAPS